jgi:hypothetical protein
MPADQLDAAAITGVLAPVFELSEHGISAVNIFEQVFPYRLDPCTIES